MKAPLSVSSPAALRYGHPASHRACSLGSRCPPRASPSSRQRLPLRDIPATGVRRPCSIPRFARQRHGTHVLLQGRQIAFERPCRHPRTSRRELSGEVFNCHLKPSNRSSDSLNDFATSVASLITSSRLRCSVFAFLGRISAQMRSPSSSIAALAALAAPAHPQGSLSRT